MYKYENSLSGDDADDIEFEKSENVEEEEVLYSQIGQVKELNEINIDLNQKSVLENFDMDSPNRPWEPPNANVEFEEQPQIDTSQWDDGFVSMSSVSSRSVLPDSNELNE